MHELTSCEQLFLGVSTLKLSRNSTDKSDESFQSTIVNTLETFFQVICLVRSVDKQPRWEVGIGDCASLAC
jgi:hypothetical protein